jgi:hypothetical protein
VSEQQQSALEEERTIDLISKEKLNIKLFI